MDLEIATILIGAENMAGFLATMDTQGSAALLSCPGCHAVTVLPGIENPDKALIMVEWESVEAHNAAKASPGFAAFHAAAGPWFAKSSGGAMEHFRLR